MRERQHHDGIQPATLALALACLASQFPDRQLNATELCIATGIGKTAMSKISQADDTPFALQKCTASRLNAWLKTHPRFKAS